MAGRDFKLKRNVFSELRRGKLTRNVRVSSRTTQADIVSDIAINIIVTSTAKDAVIPFFTLDLVVTGGAKDQVIGIAAITCALVATVDNVGNSDRTALVWQ